MLDDLLDDLDAIDWSSLTHAYGPASDVPDLIRAVAGPDQAARTQAIWELSGNVHHQGTVYEVTVNAVPFLARLARHRSMPSPDRTMLVALLGAIAGGWPSLDVRESLPAGATAPDEEAEPTRTPGHVAAARAAVGREAPILLAELAGSDGATDWRLAELASQVAEWAGTAAPLLDRLRATTHDSRLRAALDLTGDMVLGGVDEAAVTAAAASLDPWHREAIDARADLDAGRRARLIAESLFESGFEDTGLGG